MSDFDEEAERERLREKYEHDEQKREVTERMSELLLKGATMTNAHCQDCGDPIFRYDGQEFCATCQKAVQRDDGEGAEDGTEADDAAEGDRPATNGDREEIHVAAPDEETRVQFGGDRDGEDPEAPSPESDRQPEQSVQQHEESTNQQPRPDRQASTRSPSADPGARPGQGGDVRAAHASISRTVATLAQQAEAAEDLGQKRDLLAATREAAEALSAVRDASS